MRYENSKMNFAFEEQPVFVKVYLPVVIKNFKQVFDSGKFISESFLL